MDGNDTEGAARALKRRHNDHPRHAFTRESANVEVFDGNDGQRCEQRQSPGPLFEHLPGASAALEPRKGSIAVIETSLTCEVGGPRLPTAAANCRMGADNTFTAGNGYEQSLIAP